MLPPLGARGLNRRAVKNLVLVFLLATIVGTLVGYVVATLLSEALATIEAKYLLLATFCGAFCASVLTVVGLWLGRSRRRRAPGA